MRLECQFNSKCLMRKVEYLIYIPDKGVDENTKTLVFLHGIGDSAQDWIDNTRIISKLSESNVVLIFLNGENSFYVDSHESKRFGDYVGNEIVKHTQSLFNLSKDRERWSIIGYSMGGYGALRAALKYNSNYCRVIALSSALVIDNAIKATEEALYLVERKSFFESIFGDLEKLKGSDNDLEFLVKKCIQEESKIDIHIYCGIEDFLIEENRRFHSYLTTNNIEHIYQEAHGTHNWEYWSNTSEEVLTDIFDGEKVLVYGK